jgi:hypothetical protein
VTVPAGPSSSALAKPAPGAPSARPPPKPTQQQLPNPGPVVPLARRLPAKVGGLGGLLALLTERAGANIHERGVVAITASSNTGTVKNVVDCGSVSGYESGTAPNLWLCIDFKEATIKMTSYSVGLSPIRVHIRLQCLLVFVHTVITIQGIKSVS